MFILTSYGLYGLTTGSNDPGILSGRVYHIKAYNGKNLDVANALSANGTNVQIYDFNVNAACQEWVITEVGQNNGDKLYKIKDVSSGKLLSIESSSSEYAANACIWEDDNLTGQIFKIRLNSDGTYSFLTQCSNFTKILAYDSAMSVRQYYDDSAVLGSHFTIEYAGLNRYKYNKGVCDGYYVLYNVYYDTVPYYYTSTSIFDNNSEYSKMAAFVDLDELSEFYFTYYGGGYYSIKTIADGGTHYLTAPSSTSSGQKITWSNDFSESNNNQLWQMSYINTNDTYSIKSKNLVISNTDYSLQSTSSYLVQNTTSSAKSQWKLLCDETYVADNLFVGIIDPSHNNHSLWMGDAMSALYDLGTNSFALRYQANLISSVDKSLLTDDMENCNIMIMRGHGGSNGAVSSCMQITSTAENTTRYLTSSDVQSLDLSNTEIILYIGCSTAGNYNISNATNLLTASVTNAGAYMAVGFSDTIQCDNANIFAKHFAMEYKKKMSEYTDYSSMSVIEQLNVRITCYMNAISEAAILAGLTDLCVLYYDGTYATLS